MITGLILIVLSGLDTAAAGFRDAAGRNALLRKSGYYGRAALRGLAYGLVGMVAIASVVLGLTFLSADSAGLWRDFVMAGRAMIVIYGIVATLVVLALGIYLLPWFEIRSLATVIILGPFTLMRPVVITGGALYGLYTVPRWEVACLCVAIIVVMVPFGWYLALGKVNEATLEEMIELR